MYPWNNEQYLSTLHVEGEDNILVYETPKERAEVHLVDGDISKVVFSTPGNEPLVITNKESHHVVVGENNWKRDVYHYLKPGGSAPTLRLGITKHIGVGSWSSLPHNFELNTEPGFEEVFFYILEGGPQLAIQVGRGVWFDDKNVDDIWQVKNNSFSTVPMGYHPVVGEPHVRVSYVWAYLAKKKEWEKI